MITKAQIHFARALHTRKERHLQKLFLCEGFKGVKELLAGFTLHSIFVLKSREKEYTDILSQVSHEKIFTAEGKELERISTLTTAPDIIAIFHIPEENFSETIRQKGLILALDHISDPGNLGTIIRTADWYGIDTIVCSPDTVDVWSPKVVQATMGSLGRVRIFSIALGEFLKSSKLPLLVTSMEGSAVQDFSFPEDAILCMGNESVGISTELFEIASKKICIPSGQHKEAVKGKAESLNVGIATGILLHEYRRQYS